MEAKKIPSDFLKFSRPLRAHQRVALDRFARFNEAGLLWEMGTGKTTEAIALLRWRYSCAGVVEKTLIVSPKATLYNWVEEFQLNSPEKVHVTTLVIDAKGEKRALQLSLPGKMIYIMNGEALDQKKFYTELKKIKFDNFVLDEAHKFKSYKSKRLDKLIAITDKTNFRIVMTGTPLSGDNYLDVWAIWRVLDKGATFGTNFFTFRDKYFYDKNEGMLKKNPIAYFPKYEPRPEICDEIPRLMALKSSRITKEECLDLPPLTFETRFVGMSDEQSKAYKEMEDLLVAEVQQGTCAAVNALSKVSRLLQITSGYLPVEIDNEVEKLPVHFKDTPKMEALADLLEELTPAHKVIVWCTYKENYGAIGKMLDEMKIGYTSLVGGMKSPQDNIKKFQTDDKCRVMIANEQAGGAGVNLTAASYSVYYSRTYSFLNRSQSESRNHRSGSEIHKKITIIDLIVKGTIEETVFTALKRKEKFSDNVLEIIRGLREVSRNQKSV